LLLLLLLNVRRLLRRKGLTGNGASGKQRQRGSSNEDEDG
jgi:hypothetical protein